MYKRKKFIRFDTKYTCTTIPFFVFYSIPVTTERSHRDELVFYFLFPLS